MSDMLKVEFEWKDIPCAAAVSKKVLDHNPEMAVKYFAHEVLACVREVEKP